jgi:hypothetical protein
MVGSGWGGIGMIYITKTMNNILQYIIEHPNCMLRDIARDMYMTKANVNTQLSALYSRGAIVRFGEVRPHSYRASGEKVTTDPNQGSLIAKANKVFPDPMHLSDVKIRKDQENYIRYNLHLPRRELAKRLGMTKLDLNYAMDKLGLTSKLASEEEEI